MALNAKRAYNHASHTRTHTHTHTHTPTGRNQIAIVYYQYTVIIQ